MKPARFSPLALLALAAFATIATVAAPAPGATFDPLDSLRAAPVLDVSLLTRAALARNASLDALRAARRASEARADQAGSLMDPMLEGVLAPRSLGGDVVDPAWGLELSQDISIFGRRGLERRAGRAEARAAGEDVRAMRLDVAREASRLYYRMYEIARAEAVTDELRALVEQFRRVAIQKYAAGTAGQADALQAEVEIAMLDHERVALTRERRMTQARLKALLHDEGLAPLPDPPAMLPPVEGHGGAHGDALVPADDTTIDALPVVRGRAAMLEARVEEHRLARRSRLPDLKLTAGYDRFMEEKEWRPIVGVGVNLPIWFGRLKARERETQALIERADRERNAARDLARAELEGARARVEETAHEVRILETGVLPATERALVSVRAAYEANRGDFLTLLSAERDVAKARLTRHRAEATYRIALADLAWARGAMATPTAADDDREGSR